jgi:two-component system LytT family response regulator
VTKRPIRIAIAGEHDPDETGLRVLLEQESGVTLQGGFTLSCSGDPCMPDGLDLVFLRVRGGALDVPVNCIRNSPQGAPLCIVVADDDRLALRAIELHVQDYLVMPVERERLREALRWARVRLEHEPDRNADRTIGTPGLPLHGGGQRDRLMVKWRGRIFLLKIADIHWVGAEGGYVRLYCSEKKYMLRGRIGDFEQSLPHETFIRIHRSALVNIDRIAEILQLPRGEYAVLLEDGTRLSLSRSFREKVFHHFVDISKAAV